MYLTTTRRTGRKAIFRTSMVLLLISLTLSFTQSRAQTITYTPPPAGVFWGQELTSYPGTAPVGAYGSVRMNSTTWASIETERNEPITNSSWNWTTLDRFNPNVTSPNFPKGTDFLYTLYRTPTFGGTSDTEAPTDVDDTTENCEVPASSLTKTGDCVLKEYIVGLMEHVCSASSIPAKTPATNTCWLKNYELWNEFNETGYWTDSFAHLARMGQDAAVIIRLFCGDCNVSAGSTSGGGAGSLNPSVAGYTPAIAGNTHAFYDEAMGALLDDWYAIDSSTMPDFISWHPYPTWTKYTNTDSEKVALDPAPMPEFSYSGTGAGADNNEGSGTHTGSQGCPTAANGETNLTYPQCGDPVSYQAQKMTTVIATSAYHMAGKPVWATEGGYSELFDLQGTGSGVIAKDTLRAEYMARWLIILAWRNVARTYPYSYDNVCFMPQYLQQAKTCNDTLIGWSGESLPAGLTSEGTAWEQVEDWLMGATTPSCTTNADHQYVCTMTRTSPSGYHATIFWADPWGASDTFTPTPPEGKHFTQYRDLSGNTHSYSSGTITLTGSPVIFEGTD